jgi:hypothetical protein
MRQGAQGDAPARKKRRGGDEDDETEESTDGEEIQGEEDSRRDAESEPEEAGEEETERLANGRGGVAPKPQGAAWVLGTFNSCMTLKGGHRTDAVWAQLEALRLLTPRSVLLLQETGVAGDMHLESPRLTHEKFTTDLETGSNGVNGMGVLVPKEFKPTLLETGSPNVVAVKAVIHGKEMVFVSFHIQLMREVY